VERYQLIALPQSHCRFEAEHCRFFSSCILSGSLCHSFHNNEIRWRCISTWWWSPLLTCMCTTDHTCTRSTESTAVKMCFPIRGLKHPQTLFSSHCGVNSSTILMSTSGFHRDTTRNLITPADSQPLKCCTTPHLAW
jgi:hypothetical protein